MLKILIPVNILATDWKQLLISVAKAFQFATVNALHVSLKTFLWTEYFPDWKVLLLLSKTEH